ncbi:hypothetical protein ANO11243_057220 [Dothideomycetidae sp. 11243]|nr:hypothetical protein ANO11243_057220 [fungal sp. No.11243]
MQQEAQAYYDVTVLVKAVNALEAWRMVENEYVNRTPRPASVPAKVKRALEDATTCMEPLIDGILVDAKDGECSSLLYWKTRHLADCVFTTDEEAAMHASIRSKYLPEIVLSYLTVLSSAGHLISRDELLTAMDLSTVIANNERCGLRQAFAEAGRMTELVTMFAEISKVMLKLNEIGGHKRSKKERGGRGLGIWEIHG